MGFPKVSSDAWKIICNGEVGGEENWRKAYSVIEDVRRWLMDLENCPRETAEALLKEVTRDFPYFQSLTTASFPPLYLPEAFEYDLDGFLYIQNGNAWSDWIEFRLYIDTDVRKEILNDFKAFWKRIEDIDPETGKRFDEE